MALDCPTISRILGAPLEAVESNWPLILASLDAKGMNATPVLIATLATLGTETPGFAPIRELSPRNEDRDAYFVRMYWSNPTTRHALGNLSPKDAATYYGRGFIQLTGRDNYALYGGVLDLDLLGQPDLALDPSVASKILAAFFGLRHVDEAAMAGNWLRVRVRVNGGTNGWNRFSALVTELREAA